MLCKDPYIRIPTGATEKQVVLSGRADMITPHPCGKCINCRINKAREWKHRILLESMVTPKSSFVTLTYEDESLPSTPNGLATLDVQHLTGFIKRLRKRLSGRTIRYFALGEYGMNGYIPYRPHYHLILFGVHFIERTVIDESWNKPTRNGFIHTAEVSRGTASYITGYLTDKLGKKADEHLDDRLPVFSRMSNGNKSGAGGIGYPAIRKLAKAIKAKRHFKVRQIMSLQNGRQRMPLGRYLTRKLSDELGVTEDEIQEQLVNWQFNQIKNHLGTKNFKDGIIEQNKGKSDSQEWKQINFSRQKKM